MNAISIRVNKRYFTGLLDASITILSILLLIFAVPFAEGYFEKEKIQSSLDISDACRELGLLDSTACVTQLTKTFYKYNLDNLGKDLDFTTLKEQGGVCSSWSNYYNKIGKELGYNTRNVIIKVTDDFSHEFNVWSDENRYCIIDQTEAVCVEF